MADSHRSGDCVIREAVRMIIGHCSSLRFDVHVRWLPNDGTGRGRPHVQSLFATCLQQDVAEMLVKQIIQHRENISNGRYCISMIPLASNLRRGSDNLIVAISSCLIRQTYLIVILPHDLGRSSHCSCTSLPIIWPEPLSPVVSTALKYA